MKVITYEEWIEQTERMMKQQTALLKAQDSVGKSAYEIALKELGKTEEELPISEWLESLNGESAYEVYVGATEDDPVKNEEDWLESLQGETGPEGKSAYEVAVDEGFEGTIDDWFEALIGEQGPQGEQGVQGPKGEDGEDGTNGLNGADGKSAYESAVDGGLNSDGEDGEYTEEDSEFIDEEAFGTLLAELIREKFTPPV